MRNIIFTILVTTSFALGQTVKTYTELPLTAKLMNPETGFSYSLGSAVVAPISSNIPSLAELQALRNIDSCTVYDFACSLSDYKDGHAISSTDLNAIKTVLWRAHQAGVKVRVTWAYCETGCGSAVVEAPIDSCVKHIKQVMQIVRDSVALITFVKGGWMGNWGEWDYQMSGRHWDTLVIPRERIIDTVLAYLPGTRMYTVGSAYHLASTSSVRYGNPEFAWDWSTTGYTGSPLSGGIPKDTLTFAQAWDSTYKRARVGYNIDGFLYNSPNGQWEDGVFFGMYPYNYRGAGNPNNPSGVWNADNMFYYWGAPWLSRQSRFMPVYAEECGSLDGYTCSDGEYSWPEHLRLYHVSHYAYQTCPSYNFRTGIASCLDTTSNKLGYRISVVNDTIPTSINQGDTLTFRVTFKNNGYAAPYNPRRLYAVLRKSSGGYVRLNAVQSWDWRNVMIPNSEPYKYQTQTYYHPAQYTFTFKAYIDPAIVPTGTYSVGIWAPDYYPMLQNDSRYTIHFANTTNNGFSWEDSTGINSLGATVQVISGVGQGPSAPSPVSPINNAVLQSMSLRLLWSMVTGASTYQLQIAKDSHFIVIIANDSSITDTSLLVSSLDSQQVYYWRVQAKNQWGVSSWSEVFSFIIEPSGSTGVGDDASKLPSQFKLYSNYPNPFNPTTTIRYEIPYRSWVDISLFNMLGQRLETLESGEQDAGRYEIHFNAGNLSSGAYLYRMQAGNYLAAKILTLLK